MSSVDRLAGHPTDAFKGYRLRAGNPKSSYWRKARHHEVVATELACGPLKAPVVVAGRQVRELKLI